MTREDLHRLIVVDDLVVENTIRSTLSNGPFSSLEIQQVRTIEQIETQLKGRRAEETVVLINAHVRFSSSDHRFEMAGARFVRYELRTLWQRLEPVIVYSPLSKDEFTGIVHHRIFRDRPESHAYLRFPDDLEELTSTIEKVEVVLAGNLCDIILYCGAIGALVRGYKHDLETALLASQYNAEKAEKICRALSRLVPEDLQEPFRLSELSSSCIRLEGSNRIAVQNIQETIKGWRELIEERLSSRRY